MAVDEKEFDLKQIDKDIYNLFLGDPKKGFPPIFHTAKMRAILGADGHNDPDSLALLDFLRELMRSFAGVLPEAETPGYVKIRGTQAIAAMEELLSAWQTLESRLRGGQVGTHFKRWTQKAQPRKGQTQAKEPGIAEWAKGIMYPVAGTVAVFFFLLRSISSSYTGVPTVYIRKALHLFRGLGTFFDHYEKLYARFDGTQVKKEISKAYGRGNLNRWLYFNRVYARIFRKLGKRIALVASMAKKEA